MTVTTTQNNQEEQKALIMVVDDNIEFLNGIDLTLQMEDFEVWTVSEGQKALDELRAAFRERFEENPRYTRLPDLILADIMMPEMDGYEFYDQVRKNPYLNHIPFIFLTAKGEVDDIRYGKELGIDDYLPKLTATEDVLATIRGKLKRVEQRRAIAEQFTWNPNKPLEGRGLIFTAFIIALIASGFILGYLVATIFTGA